MPIRSRSANSRGGSTESPPRPARNRCVPFRHAFWAGNRDPTQAGFADVANLHGGMLLWQQMGLPQELRCAGQRPLGTRRAAELHKSIGGRVSLPQTNLCHNMVGRVASWRSRLSSAASLNDYPVVEAVEKPVFQGILDKEIWRGFSRHFLLPFDCLDRVRNAWRLRQHASATFAFVSFYPYPIPVMRHGFSMLWTRQKSFHTAYRPSSGRAAWKRFSLLLCRMFPKTGSTVAKRLP